MDKLKKAWAWLNANATAVIFTIISILFAGIAWKYHRKRLADVQDRLDVAEATKKIAVLNTKRKNLSARTEEEAARIDKIDKQLLENKRVVVEALEYSEPLSDNQVLAEFARLGI